MTTDLIVIGAGAAGLAAAKTARDYGLRVTLLEAKNRIGGRAFTETERFGVPVDHGCHWLHAASVNPLTALADAYDFPYQRTHPPQRVVALPPAHPLGADASDDYQRYCERCWQAALDAAELGQDIAVADVVDRDSRWYPLFSAWCAALNGTEPEHCSTLDLLLYRETGEDWGVADGYGALIARYGRDVDVSLNAPVTALEWNGDGVRVHSARGTLTARAALLTISTGVLASAAIAFIPPLPATKRDALDALPLGLANKIILQFEPGTLDPEPTYLRIDNASRDTIGFQLRPFGRELAVGYVAGEFAERLERAGSAAAVDAALTQLQDALGGELRRKLIRSEVTAWGADPHVLGAYSIALPGRADQRNALAEPLAGRLFFAGEATSVAAYGTAHGAYQSGVDAATKIAATLGFLPP